MFSEIKVIFSFRWTNSLALDHAFRYQNVSFNIFVILTFTADSRTLLIHETIKI